MSFQITDRSIYKTTHWTIESEDNTYYVQCQEGMFDDTWYIHSDEFDVNIHSDLGVKLIEMCQFDWEMDGNEI